MKSGFASLSLSFPFCPRAAGILVITRPVRRSEVIWAETSVFNAWVIGSFYRLGHSFSLPCNIKAWLALHRSWSKPDIGGA